MRISLGQIGNRTGASKKTVEQIRLIMKEGKTFGRYEKVTEGIWPEETFSSTRVFVDSCRVREHDLVVFMDQE